MEITLNFSKIEKNLKGITSFSTGIQVGKLHRTLFNVIVPKELFRADE